MNFLNKTEIKSIYHPKQGGRLRGFFSHKSVKIIMLALAVCVLVIGIFGAIIIPPLWGAYKSVMLGKANLESAQALLLEKEDFSEAQAKLADASENFISADDALTGMPSMFKRAPIIGTQISAAHKLLSSGVDVTNQVIHLADLMNAIVAPLKENSSHKSLAEISNDEKRIILSSIVSSPPQLAEIQTQLEQAQSNIRAIPTNGLLGPLSSAISEFNSKIDTLVLGLSDAQKIISIVPPLAGYPTPTTYLFLLQNNAELRPTGGFLGAYGIITVSNAEITSFKTDNTYNLDQLVQDSLSITPPAPLTKYNRVEKWFFRDSNWSPDFPESAATALSFYRREGGQANIDNVIAITPTVLEYLLALTGPMTVDGIEFTSSNARDTLIFQVEKGYVAQGKDFENRKEIIGDLGKAILDRVLHLPKDKWPQIAATLTDLIREKHILVWARNEGLEQRIIENGWGGEVQTISPVEDSLFLVDANLASLKTDRVMERSIAYKVTQDETGALIADARITYRNTAKGFDDFTTRYRTYTRLYVPTGSILLSSDGAMANDRTTRKGTVDVTEDLGRTVFGAFIAIEPQEEGSLQFQYRLPDSVRDALRQGSYRLSVFKQPGTIAHRLQAIIDLGVPIKAFTPLDKGRKTSNTSVEFEWDLGEDRAFEVRLGT